MHARLMGENLIMWLQGGNALVQEQNVLPSELEKTQWLPAFLYFYTPQLQ